MGGRNVEKAQLVGAGGVIGNGRFHGIAGVAQIDKVDALDHPAVLDVETGDHAHLEHGLLLSRGASAADQRQRHGRIEAAVIERAARDRAGQSLGARRQQRFYILDRGQAAGGDDRN